MQPDNAKLQKHLANIETILLDNLQAKIDKMLANQAHLSQQLATIAKRVKDIDYRVTR